MAADSAEDQQKHVKSRQKTRKDMICKCVGWMRRNCFLLALLTATVGGYALGLSLQSQRLSNHVVHLIGFPGQLVVRSFFMIIVPLIFCSIVLGISSLRKGGDAKMMVITIAFFLGLSTFSAVMGATAGHVVHPGSKITSGDIQGQSTFSGRKGVILDSILDLLWNAIPSNIIAATFSQEFTQVEVLNLNSSDDGGPLHIYKKSIQKKQGVNFMGLLSFSILFGCALATLGKKGEVLHQAIEQLNAVVLKIMHYFLNLLPLGMFFWMFREGLQSTASVHLLEYMGVFLATTFGCFALHQFLLLPLLYLLIVRRNPLRYHLNLLPAILTAFGTSSSAATLPTTVRCTEESNCVNRCVTRVVLPLGMVVHMNGGCVYLPLTAIFLAQLEGIDLGVSETVAICLTSILLSIAAPAATGSANPVYILTTMAAAGIHKPQFISIYLSLEWLMDRFRTVMNVVSDCYVAAFVEKLCAKRLPLDYDDIEYPSPVPDGHTHATETTATARADSVCGCCRSRVNV